MSNVNGSTLNHMISVPVSEFVAGTALPSDIYVKLTAEKFILIAKEGEKAQLNTHKVIKNSRVKEVWVDRKDFTKFLLQAIKFVELSQNNKNSKAEHRIYFLRSATAAMYRHLEQFGVGPELVGFSKVITEATTATIQANASLNDILKGLKMAAPHVFNLSLATCAFSVMLAKEMRWSTKGAVDKLALGSLLADIGQTRLPRNIIEKSTSKMHPKELQLYQQHPTIGMRMLEPLKDISADILHIVHEHHENSQGLGYPQGMRDVKQSPMAKIVALAAQFCELVIATPQNPSPMTPLQALNHIDDVLLQPFNKDVFAALARIVQSENMELSKAG